MIYLSASGMDRFACENKWTLDQFDRAAKDEENATAVAEIGPPSEWVEVNGDQAPDYLRLGTLWHRLTAAWRGGKLWTSEWEAALSEEGGKEDAVFKKAFDLMARYVAFYGAAPFPIIANELPFDLPVPGVPGVRVHGFLDGVGDSGTRRKPKIWAWEDKTMGRWGKDKTAATSTQNLLYLWAVRHLFNEVEGLVFDAVSTYDYKNPEPGQPFRRILVPYDARAEARIVDDLQRVAKRAKILMQKPHLAVRAVGDACNWCSFTTPCLTPWELEQAA